MGLWIAMGVAMGAVFGLAVFDSLAAGMAFWLPIGVIGEIFYGKR